ncbi:MFS family permease [Virgibacillus natechei]|uniref:MFS family permease n=1 Tax=Virgibacillus natechei TaxID=1216297 RepID=A0ABS4IIN1_9BACI|nr:MFS transporter [Virgibacillus natechei]MBP1970787.1 MFS family permease [Virgibacillus natechei]UZD12312.1 MFS transporter [Virgibacillus natechei]
MLRVFGLVRFIQGVAYGVATTARISAVMDMIPDSKRGEGTGYFALSTTIVTAVGPFLCHLITQNADYEMIFTTCTGFLYKFTNYTICKGP